MKFIVISCLILLVLSAFIQFIGYRRYKKEFDAFYQRYAGSGHFIPPYVAFADSLGMLGTSLKAQWFLWILKRKKIKIRGQVWLDAKTYDFVQKTASPELQKWLAMDFILLLVEAIITTVGCIFIYLIKINV
ncbi:hypothetical protein [Serratia marcescens]|uniref:hypothetical protein n=2 Tax=Serratia TaxID=613 RepID=UPI0013DD246C|nr:hypothetical protein [Serratia marcescens]NSM14440.1 hypothetical protein [Serratia marcescens]NSM94453.1 hypothetical protein [Serratia marcescens]CAF2545010.1 hypothetical protein AI2872V1_0441 [Serratia marcescens]CAF2641143.1 hypothetical protein AI2884V1_0441 [Serratia marcescens]CAH5044947.1 hypothetical protein AI2872V1_0441 [Serratia marcescens]